MRCCCCLLLLAVAVLVLVVHPAAGGVPNLIRTFAIWPLEIPQVLNVDYGQFIRHEPSACWCTRSGPTVLCKECARMPTSLAFSERTFVLAFSRLRQIAAADAFAGDSLVGLEQLTINQNRHLERLEPGCFRQLGRLQHLAISLNRNLRVLEEGVFEGLGRLRRLGLMGNGFARLGDLVPALAPRHLPHVEWLSLAMNDFRNVSEEDFRPLNGTKLEVLILVMCRIVSIHPMALAPFQRLKKLFVGQNDLSAGPLTTLLLSLPRQRIWLDTLNLFGLDLREDSHLAPLLAAIVSMGSIHTLSLASNRLSRLPDHFFPIDSHIERLDLRDNVLVDLQQHALTNLRNLSELLVGHNYLSSVQPGLRLPRLQRLDVSDSSTVLSYMFDLDAGVFSEMGGLRYLRLSHNVLNRALSPDVFRGLENLEELHLVAVYIIVVHQDTFRPLRRLRLLDLSDNPFLFRDRYNTYDHIFRHLSGLERLILRDCQMTFLPENATPFAPLVSLQYLDLSSNSLVKFAPKLFWPLRSLRQLDLSQNEIVTWQEPLFPPQNNSVQMIDLRENKLVYPSEAFLSDVRNATLDLTKNPFVCNCSLFLKVVDWQLTPHFHMVNNESVLCVEPAMWRRRSVLEYVRLEAKRCGRQVLPVHLDVHIFYSVPYLVLLVLALLGLLQLYLRRRYVHYYLFLLRLAVTRRRRNRQSSGEERARAEGAAFRYDAFVSHSSEDWAFVELLVQQLEPAYRLCVFERDFAAGAVISDEVLKSLQSSRRTILVISRSFARSQWCRWETQLAQHHRLFTTADDDDCLVMLRYGHMSTSLMTPALKYLVKTRKYLQWEPNDADKQAEFWAELKRLLGQKDGEEMLMK